MSSTLPLFPTDDGWPYPDQPITAMVDPADAAVDVDALEMLGPHCYDALTAREREALFAHFGLRGREPVPMKALAPMLGCTRAEAAALIGSAVDKVRRNVTQD